jgi:hypothetical protein
LTPNRKACGIAIHFKRLWTPFQQLASFIESYRSPVRLRYGMSLAQDVCYFTEPIIRRCVVQPAGLIDDLLYVHRYRHALGDAAGQCAGFGSLGDARRLIQWQTNFRKNDGDGPFGNCAVDAVPPLRGQ